MLKLSILTFGYNCVCKMFVKNYLNLYLFNTPFDWNIIHDTSFIQILIDNNFENFITEDLFPNEEFLKKMGYTNKNHLRLDNKIYNFSFMHEPISEKNNIYFYDIINIISTYKKRIERFYKSINDSDKIILLYNEKNVSLQDKVFIFENNQIQINNEKTQKDFDELIVFLKNKYPGKLFEYHIINDKISFDKCEHHILNEISLSELINGDKY